MIYVIGMYFDLKLRIRRLNIIRQQAVKLCHLSGGGLNLAIQLRRSGFYLPVEVGFIRKSFTNPNEPAEKKRNNCNCLSILSEFVQHNLRSEQFSVSWPVKNYDL